MATGELECLARRLGELLCERGLTIATAESCTGGWIGQAITAVPGSSRWFESGFITYSNTAKQNLLGVTNATLAAHGAVSEPVVAAMANSALQLTGADISVAVSGVAGPGGGSALKPVGMVCIGWARAGGATQTQTRQFTGDRTDVRYQTVLAALAGACKLLESPTC